MSVKLIKISSFILYPIIFEYTAFLLLYHDTYESFSLFLFYLMHVTSALSKVLLPETGPLYYLLWCTLHTWLSPIMMLCSLLKALLPL